MGYPVGVITRNCTFSGAVDAEDGSPVAPYNVRAIVSCNDKIVHLSTGVILIPTPQIFTSSFELPVTDQDGIWGDGEGNYFVGGNGWNTHSYRIDLEFEQVTGEWQALKAINSLIIETSLADLDLDLAFDPDRTSYDG